MKKQEHLVTSSAMTNSVINKSVGLQTSSTLESSTGTVTPSPDKIPEEADMDTSMALLASQSTPDLVIQSGIAMST